MPLRKLERRFPRAHHERVRVRAANAADEEFVRELAGEVFSPYGDYRPLLPKWFKVPGVMTFVSEEGKERTGYVMVAFFREEAGLVGDVLAIAVEPAHQGRGTGRTLLSHAIAVCEQVAEHSPVQGIRLSVASTNARARHLFESLGFLLVDGDFGSYEGGQKALHMRRPVGPQGSTPPAAGG